MARIPLINGGNIPLKNTGTRVARTAQLEAPNGAMGGALVQLGGDIADIAAKVAQANDARQLIEGEGMMRAAVARQTDFQQKNPEQDAWLENWQRESRALESQFDKMKLTERGRLALTQSFGRFSDTHTLEVRNQAFSQAQHRAKLAFSNRMNEAVESGDPLAVQSLGALANEAGFLPEEKEAILSKSLKAAEDKRFQKLADEVEVLSMEGNSDAADELLQNSGLDKGSTEFRKLQAQVVYGHAVKDDLSKAEEMISVNPKQAALDLESKPGLFPYLTEGQRLELAKTAKARLAAESADVLENVRQQIEMGSITKPEEIPEDKLSPYMAFQAKKLLAIKKHEAGVNDRDLHREMVAEIANFSPNPEAGGLDVADLQSSIRVNFTGDYQAGLLEQLDNQLRGKGLDVPISESLALVEGAMFTKREQAVNEQGFPIVKTVKEKTVQPGMLWGEKVVETEKDVPVIKENPIAKAREGEIKTRINKQIEKEIRAGELKTQGEIMDRATQLIMDAGGVLPDDFGGKPIPVNGEMPSLQSGGADFNNPILPNLTNEALSILDDANQ